MSGKRQEGVMLPLAIGGMYKPFLGPVDVSNLPDGKAYIMSGLVRRSGGWQSGPSFVAITPTAVTSMAAWEDSANSVTRLVACKLNGANGDLYLQDVSAATFAGSAAATITGATTFVDATNYRGRLFLSAGTAIYAFTGSALTTNALGGETVYADSLATFEDRIFLGRLHATIPNLLSLAQTYDPTAGMTFKNCVGQVITNGTTITGRVTPSDASEARFVSAAPTITVAASTTDTAYVYSCALRNTSASFDMPVTIELVYVTPWAATTAVVKDEIRTELGSLTVPVKRFRCTVGGTTGATQPTWVLGATTTDGTATWVVEGDDIAASKITTIPQLSDSPNFIVNTIRAIIPANPVATNLKYRVRFGNSDSPVYPLAALDVSFRDGKADGTLGKANFGQQITKGRFFYDFYNQETTQTATKVYDDRVYWTETSNPDDLRGSAYYKCDEVAGPITAVRAVGGRLVVFKKRAMWVFAGTLDPDNALRKEKFYAYAGCVGPFATDSFEDTLYFAGADEVYSWQVGKDKPTPLAGDAMRDQLFASAGNGPFSVCVDQKNRDVWFGHSSVVSPAFANVYHLPTAEWSQIQNPVLDSTIRLAFSTTVDTLFEYGSGSSTYRVTELAGTGSQWSPRYLTAPDGYELAVKRVWLRYVRAGSFSVAIAVGYNVGATRVTKSITYTLPSSTGTGIALSVPLAIDQRGDKFSFDFVFTSASSCLIVNAAAECDVIPSNPTQSLATTAGTLS